MTLLKIHPDNPSAHKISKVVEILRAGGLIIFPTDTVYALACAVDQRKAYENLCRIKDIQPAKARFSLIFDDLSQASKYLSQLDTPTFRILKRNLPGPFTFVLPSGNDFPVHMKNKRKTIGVRIPDHNVSLAIVRALGLPLVTASLKQDDDIVEYYLDPEDIYNDFRNRVEMVIDSGAGKFTPSTIVNLTGETPEILRQGQGELLL